jgi:ATP-binding cassette subfamily F protein 3
VILVSHDMHLLSLVADRLWLVKDGGVAPYSGDLDSYRAELLAPPAPAGKQKSAKQTQKSAPPAATPPSAPKPARDARQNLKKTLRESEARVAKLAEMMEKLDAIMADPKLYATARAAEAERWSKKHAELREAMARAEGLWLEALENFEAAEKG